jgi:hypothetical protein
MITMRTIALLSLLMAAGLLAGCTKDVDLTFVNVGDKSMDVQLTTPNAGTESVGMVPPMGGKLKTTVKIPTDDLPANCAWQANEFNGQFTITKDTPNKLWIDIAPGRVRDKKSTVFERKQDTHQEKVEQKTIVE